MTWHTHTHTHTRKRIRAPKTAFKTTFPRTRACVRVCMYVLFIRLGCSKKVQLYVHALLGQNKLPERAENVGRFRNYLREISACPETIARFSRSNRSSHTHTHTYGDTYVAMYHVNPYGLPWNLVKTIRLHGGNRKTRVASLNATGNVQKKEICYNTHTHTQSVRWQFDVHTHCALQIGRSNEEDRRDDHYFGFFLSVFRQRLDAASRLY